MTPAAPRSPSSAPATQHASIAAAFVARAASTPDRVALRAFERDVSLTFEAWLDRSRRVAGGLEALGVRRGDRVAMLLTTCVDFYVCDIGALLLGAVPFSLYATSPAVQLVEIAANAEPRVLITEAALVDRAREVAAATPSIEALVVVEPEAVRDGQLSLAALEERCAADFDLDAAVAGTAREDLCTIVYTSGTTGPPKGVEFRHGSMLDNLAGMEQRFPVSEDDRAVSYLPMAHIGERIFGLYAALIYGYEVTALPDMSRLGAALHAVRPTRFFGVPRIYEKLVAAVHRHVAESPDRDALRAALGRRLEVVRAEQRGDAVDGGPQDAVDLETLRPLASLTGLERTRFTAVATAPSSPDMLEELAAIGLPVNEFYGASEAIIISCSPPDRVRFGTVGTPLPGVELRLAGDGEILLKGGAITPGYFRDPERTAEAFDEDDWFRTGDVGTLDDEGYLRIVDRKKTMIINASGKNMSPANIEQAIKGGQPLISQVVAIGDRRSYVVGLVVLDRDGVAGFAHEHGLGDRSFEELTGDPAVRAAIDAAVEAGNARLARVEQLKRWHVLDHDWAPGGDELTPTAKLKRPGIVARYAAEIEALYA
ncbi:AMP-dependent synthetase/ligase [Patulibacter minatonensis]|uniref:AMP-dependent synthetase/ligase n=1 Tax=Patulibacter minatonensis TaxID=298163 RepID=UPI00047B7C23|nr:long-chain fatty acid--CoA ligase [Patulibacter minatonensis]